MAVKFANNVSTTLSAAINATQTTISVADASGLPTLSSGDYVYLTIDTDTNSPTIEVVKVTAISSNSLTVVRGQDGTTASSFSSGTKVELRVTAAALDDISSAADTESVSIDGDTMTGALKVSMPHSTTYSDSLTWTEQSYDALKVINANSTTSADQFSSIFMQASGGGNATARIVLRNDNSGNGRLYFQMRSGVHTGVTQPKMLITDDGYVTISDNANTYTDRLFVDGTLRAEDGIKVGATRIVTSGRALQNIASISSGAITSSGNIVNDIGNSGNDSFIELKNTGYTGNVTSLRQNADSTRAELNATERPIYIQAGSGGGSTGAEIRLYANQQLGYKLDANKASTFYGLLHLDRSTGTASSTTGTTFLKIDNYVGSDLQQQKSFIDFIFQDDNTNETPQVRIGAEVGQNGDANSQEKEGSGAFVVYTNNAESTSGDAGTSLAERFRVDYAGNATITGTTTSSDIGQFKRDIRSAGQIRATGWYNDAASTDYTGLAFEIGVSGSKAYGLSYNRSTASYGPMRFDATSFEFNRGSAFNILTGDFQIGGTTVINSSRNMTNIGTISSGAITSSGLITGDSFLSGYGSASSPAFQVGDTNSGFYDSGSDSIGVALGGVKEYEFLPAQFNLQDNDLVTQGVVQAGTGSATSPSFQVGDNDSGFYDSGANEIGVTLGGVDEYEFTPDQFDMKGNNLVDAGTADIDGFVLANSSHRTGLLSIPQRDSGNSYTGIQLLRDNGEHWQFMASDSIVGLYEDTTGHWALQASKSAGTRLYYANQNKLETLTDGVQITGRLTAAATNYDNAFNFGFTDSDPENSYVGMRLDYNASGNTALTADRTHVGLEIDYDVSATGGDTSNEYRAYALSIDLRGAGDTDLRRGIYSYSETQHDAGTVSENVAVYGYAVADETGTGRTTNNYGGLFLAYENGTGSGGTNTHYGVFAKAHANSLADKNIGSMYGVFAEVEYDTTGATTSISTIYGVRSVIDNDSTDTTLTNSYLFHGSYEGTINATNAYGLYINGNVENYFAGHVRADQGYRVGSTTVIDSSRNLTNIGTISSGAITSSGQITAKSAVLTDDGSGSPLLKISADDNVPWAIQLYREDLGGGPQVFASNTTTWSFQGHIDLRPTYAYKVDGTTVIDSSRNLTNIGTISSGAITSSGVVTSSALQFGSNFTNPTTNTATFYNQSGVGPTASGYKFQVRTGSSNAMAAAITVDNSQNTQLHGTLTSGAITSSGNIVGVGINSTANYTELGSTSSSSLVFKRNNASYIQADASGGYFIFVTNGRSTSYANRALALTTDNNAEFSGNVNTVGNVTVGGNLTVNGTTTTLNTATLNVEDKNIVLNYASGDTSGSADGAGITIQDAVNSTTDATILWDATNDEFDFSHPINVSGNSKVVGSSTSTGRALIVEDSDNSNLLYVNNAGEVVISKNYLYVNNNGGIYSNGSIKARGGITNDGGDNLSISSGGTDIEFNSKNFTSVGTISSGSITSSSNITASGGITASGNITASGGASVITAGTTTGYLYAKSLRLVNGEIDDSDFQHAYQMIVDANDVTGYMSDDGNVAGSGPFGIYFLGDNGATTKTLGSGLVGVWNTTNFKKAHVEHMVGLYGGTQDLTAPNISVTGNLDVVQSIRHTGDTNTAINFFNDEVEIRTGGTPRLSITNSDFIFSNTQVRFDATMGIGAITYAPIEGNTEAERNWFNIHRANDASYIEITNRTPAGKVVLSGGLDGGGGEVQRLEIEGGSATKSVKILASTNLDLSSTSNLKMGGTTVIDSSRHITAPQIRLTSTFDATVSSTAHALQIGPDNDANVVMDSNEIMARNNGATSDLHINPDGGGVTVGNNTSGTGSLVVKGTGYFSKDLTLEGNDVEIRFAGGNNRILFSGYRALEGATNGGILQVGEGYTTVQSYGHLNLTSGHDYQVNGTTVIDSSRQFLVNSHIYFGGATNQSFIRQSSTNLEFFGDGNLSFRTYNGGWYERLNVDDGGINVTGTVEIGGTTVIDSSRGLTNISGLNLSSSTTSGMKLTATDSTANASFYGFTIDYNASGSDTTTADRIHAGLYIDADSSASGGGTSHEHRFYGAYITATASGDSDIIDGAFMQGRADNFGTGNQVTYLRGANASATAHHDAGTIASTMAVYGYGQDSSSGSGQSSNVYGGYFVAYGASTSSYTGTNFIGARAFAQIGASQSSNIASAVAVWGEVQLDNDAAADHDVTISNAYVFRAEYDENDADDTYTVNQSFLYYGNYAGTLPTTAWGVYIVDDVPNYFAGTIRTSDGSTTTASYGFNGDVNTGMYSPANHEVGFLANGTQKLKVNADGITVTGEVRVNSNSNDTSSSMAAQTPKLYVNGYTSLGSLRINGTDTGNTIYKTGGDLSIIVGSANFIKLGTSGAERVRITNDGLQIRGGEELRAYRADNARSTRVYTDNSYGYLETDTDPLMIKSANRIEFRTNGNDHRFSISNGGTLEIGSSNTAILTQSRDLQNINSISSGAITIEEFTNTTGTTGSTLLTLTNYVGTTTGNGDLSQQKTFIDFALKDGNSNETPQVRIGAEVGENADANAVSLEGSGAFVVYTNDADTDAGDAGASLTEKLRVDYAGDVHIKTGSLIATDGSVSNPSIYFGTDADTGFYHDTASDFFTATNGGADTVKFGPSDTYLYKEVHFAHSANATISTPSATFRQAADGAGTTYYHINFTKSGGTSTTRLGGITSNSYGTTYSTSSDYRLKENVNYDWDATSRLLQLRPCQFNWIGDTTNALIDGFLAHEVEDIVEDAVVGEKDATSVVDGETVIDPQSIDQSKLVPLLVKTIQELEARIAALEAQNP